MDSNDPYFSEAGSAETVIARMQNCPDERLRTIMSSVVRHLHECVKEVEPTEEEWMAAIKFLTEVGQNCTDWRQEYILLSDVIGVSMLIDAINNRKPTGATESTVLGPFHIADAPRKSHGETICLDGKGEPLVVSGLVADVDGNPIPGAMLDVWQANNDGFYDVQQKGVQPDMNLRGVFETDSNGGYWFKSAKPTYYPVPDDGPVGQMLRATGRHAFRPAHIHFIISADGYLPVTTHIFVPDDPYLDSDAVFGVKQSLVGDFVRVDNASLATAASVDNPYWTLESNFTLQRLADRPQS